MEDFVGFILGALLEIFGEFLAELAAELLGSLALRVFRGAARRLQELGGRFQFVVLLFAGAVAGAISVLIVPHALFPPSKVHGISMLISPFCTGAAMWMLGTAFGARTEGTASLGTFRNGFVFALGMAAVRFFFLK